MSNIKTLLRLLASSPQARPLTFVAGESRKPVQHYTGDSVETPAVLRQLISARVALAELKGEAKTIGNQNILIALLSMQEAHGNATLADVPSTQDDLHRFALAEKAAPPEIQAVLHVWKGLLISWGSLRRNGYFGEENFLETYKLVVPHDQMEESAINDSAEHPEQPTGALSRARTLLEQFHAEEETTYDPLVCMALLLKKQQGDVDNRLDTQITRMLAGLYLVKEGLIETPILPLSRVFSNTREDYIKLSKDAESTEAWLLYVLTSVRIAAQSARQLVASLHALLQDYERDMQKQLPKIYSQTLLHTLFRYPYVRIGRVEEILSCSYLTARSYLKQLCDADFIEEQRQGRNNYYVNVKLMALLRAPLAV